MEPEKQIPCPFVTPRNCWQANGASSSCTAPRTNPAVRAITEANAQNDPRHIVQTTEIAGSQRSYRPHGIPRRTAKSGIQRQPNWGGFLSRAG